MKQLLEDIRQRALAALDAADSPAALEELRVKLLGKKGELTAVLKQMGRLSAEERPVIGQLANAVRRTWSGSWRSGRPPCTPPRWRPGWPPRRWTSPYRGRRCLWAVSIP